LFIGQLDFLTTKEDILQHLVQHGVEGDIKIRMMTNQTTGEFRGAAFVEVENPTALFTCLTLHHSILKGRKINIEKTCGGRNKDNRSTKINYQKSEQQLKIATMIDRILKEYEDRNLLTIDSLSEEMKERLYGLTVGTVSKILKRLSSIPGCEHIDLAHLEKKIKKEERKIAQVEIVAVHDPINNGVDYEDDVSNIETENDTNEANSIKRKEAEVNGDFSSNKRKVSLIHVEQGKEEKRENDVKAEKIESKLKLKKKQKI